MYFKKEKTNCPLSACDCRPGPQEAEARRLLCVQGQDNQRYIIAKTQTVWTFSGSVTLKHFVKSVLSIIDCSFFGTAAILDCAFSLFYQVLGC